MKYPLLASLLAALLLAGVSMLASCTPTHGTTDVASAAPPVAPLAATFDAHGGLDRFRAFRQFGYTMRGFPLSPQMARPNRSTVDLVSRANRIDGDGFTVGFDGATAWSAPGPDAAGLPTRFVALGSFYFIGMPFVFGDAGAIVTPAGTQTYRGEPYRVFTVAYRNGIGHTSEDEYAVFVDPRTDRLALIHHSVTENPDVDRVTWVFDRWQRVDGLLVPAQMTFHAGWNPDDPGPGASFVIEEATFARERPDATLYAPPATVLTDALPST